MTLQKQKFEFNQTVKAAPAETFFAFTNATALKEWLCDVATIRPKPGGRLFLSWNSGFYTCGEFTQVETDSHLAFTWHGRGEPHPSQVEIRLDALEEGTHVRLTHSGIGTGEEWANAVQEIQKGWSGSLENLASVLEKGEDQRIVLRPMLGIYPSDFDADVAEKLGVPVKEGIRLDDVVEGMGAARAGLEKNDVIVSMAGSSITDYPSLSSAIQHQRAGNIVEVVFYRGSEKRTVNMELSRRNIPEIPATVSDLAQAATDHYAQIEREVDQFFKDVTEAEASFKPQPDEWSVKEVLAHLILSERATQAFIVDVLAGQEKWSDEYSDNIQPPISALTAVHPTLPGMLDELKRCYAESIALYTNIPADFPEKRRGSYWRIAYYLLDGTVHEHFHFDQMKAAIEAAQKA